jgi:hypothetical protein
LADGDLIQTSRGDRVTTRLVFHFKDGSIHDETAVYSQRQRFRLITNHLVQKGPTFPQPLDMSIDGSSGRVTVRYADDGKQRVETERIDVPPDLANGLILTLLKNVQTGAPPKTVSLVAATPKPGLVKLAITAAGDEPFSTGGAARKATHYVLRVEIGGVSGVLAPLLPSRSETRLDSLMWASSSRDSNRLWSWTRLRVIWYLRRITVRQSRCLASGTKLKVSSWATKRLTKRSALGKSFFRPPAPRFD